MNDLLTPEQIAAIKDRCGFMVTCGFADDSEKDVVALLRDREAIAAKIERGIQECSTRDELERNLRALVTAIRGEK